MVPSRSVKAGATGAASTSWLTTVDLVQRLACNGKAESPCIMQLLLPWAAGLDAETHLLQYMAQKGAS